VLAVAAGGLFFGSVARLWPLARIDLDTPHAALEPVARATLVDLGFDVARHRTSSRLVVDADALDWVERAFGLDAAQDAIGSGLPLYGYRVLLKRRGDPTVYRVELHPGTGVLGWSADLEDDAEGPRLAAATARELAVAAVERGLGLDLAAFDERAAALHERPGRRDHELVWERVLRERPELRERVTIGVAGDRVAAARREIVVPPPAERAARAAEAPGVALETVGFGALAAGAVAAFFVFLARLRDGTVRLGRAAVWPTAVFACLMGTFGLETSAVFAAWDPLWPPWVSALRYFVLRAVEQAWVLVVLLAVVGAGDALDREGGSGRGASLWALARGRVLDPGVARASGTGFLVGLLCGGVLAGSALVLRATAGAAVSIQPRGFFFFTLNSAAPALTSLLFFFGVALAEELGYRFFGGTWIERLTGRRALAVVLPALVYGLTHTRLDFLPPASPFWGRAVVLTLVGCVWGWALFRFDALTVVLSHYTADLFLFQWPHLAGATGAAAALAAIPMAVPLAPCAARLVAVRLGLVRDGG